MMEQTHVEVGLGDEQPVCSALPGRQEGRQMSQQQNEIRQARVGSEMGHLCLDINNLMQNGLLLESWNVQAVMQPQDDAQVGALQEAVDGVSADHAVAVLALSRRVGEV